MEARVRWMLACAIAPISWGATYYLTRHFLPQGAPLWSGALRALPAGLLLLLVARQLPHGRWWWRSLVLGLLNFAVFFVLTYLAAQLLPTSVAASLMALAPITLVLMAMPLLGQRPAVGVLVGAAIGVVGVMLLVGLGGASIDGWGVTASIAALLLSSLGSILTTRWQGETSLVATTSWQLVAGGLVLLVAAIAIEGPPPSVTAVNVAAYAVISVVSTALAFLCWFAGLKHLPAGVVGLVGLLNPVTGVLLGLVLAAESLAPLQWVGMALVGAALLLGRVTKKSAPR